MAGGSPKYLICLAFWPTVRTVRRPRRRSRALALRVGAERLEHGEAGPEHLDISIQAA